MHGYGPVPIHMRTDPHSITVLRFAHNVRKVPFNLSPRWSAQSVTELVRCRDRQAGRQADRQTDRQTDIHTDTSQCCNSR